MNLHHKQLLNKIKSVSKLTSSRTNSFVYTGSTHPAWEISVPTMRQIVKDWHAQNKGISHSELTGLLDSLYTGKSKEEKKLLGYLLSKFKSYREQIELIKLDSWLGELVGWQEVDCTCQGVFGADELLGSWGQWGKFLNKLSKDQNISKRRASLVLLTTPVKKSSDTRLLYLSLEIIDRLKHEKVILITKAISWLLRELTVNHRETVIDYLNQNESSLPKIAVRETRRKIKTGRK